MRQALGGARGGVAAHDDHNPDETDRWEKEQIRKGVATLVSITVIASIQQVNNAYFGFI